MEKRIFKSSDTNVMKFVFTGDDIAVEAVLYRYGNFKVRTVICCSTQCGCPMGCKFCGTGKMFVRSLTAEEIEEQVHSALEEIDCDTADIEKFQIMFMSMGEPFLNYENVKRAIVDLHADYPNAQLLISTVAPTTLPEHMDDFIKLSNEIDKVGLQFSVHESTDEARGLLVPSRTLTLRGISEMGEKWAIGTGRRPFFNYCVHEGNDTQEDADRLASLFAPSVWEATLSVICEKDETMKASIDRQLDRINAFSSKLLGKGISVRVFNPAGQDDIGGGCGQLWFFQKWRKEHAVGSV